MGKDFIALRKKSRSERELQKRRCQGGLRAVPEELNLLSGKGEKEWKTHQAGGSQK